LSRISKNTPIPGNKLRKGIMSLERILGYAAVEARVYDLENYGITLEAGQATYTLQQVEDALKKVLGNEGGPLIMDQLMKILEE
jgi:hypothetical protein